GSTDLRDLVAAVGGDRVGVDSLTDPRQDPHAREIVPRQVALLKSAALLVRVGLDHEPWLPRAVAAAGAPPRDADVARAVVVLDSELPRLSAGARPHLRASRHPRFWLGPASSRPLTARILDAPGAARPEARGASPAIVRRLADATGARVVTLAPSVGAEPAATDYLALFDVNVERLARALGGEATNPAGAPRPQ